MTKYEIKNTTQFKKDYKLAKRRGLNLELLKEIVTKLANGESLDPKHKDHPLSGNWGWTPRMPHLTRLAAHLSLR